MLPPTCLTNWIVINICVHRHFVVQGERRANISDSYWMTNSISIDTQNCKDNPIGNNNYKDIANSSAYWNLALSFVVTCGTTWPWHNKSQQKCAYIKQRPRSSRNRKLITLLKVYHKWTTQNASVQKRRRQVKLIYVNVMFIWHADWEDWLRDANTISNRPSELLHHHPLWPRHTDTPIWHTQQPYLWLCSVLGT